MLWKWALTSCLKDLSQIKDETGGENKFHLFIPEALLGQVQAHSSSLIVPRLPDWEIARQAWCAICVRKGRWWAFSRAWNTIFNVIQLYFDTVQCFCTIFIPLFITLESHFYNLVQSTNFYVSRMNFRFHSEVWLRYCKYIADIFLNKKTLLN